MSFTFFQTIVELAPWVGVDIQENRLHTIWQETLGFTVIKFQRSIDTDLISTFFISSIRHKLKNQLFRELFPQVDFESSNSRLSAIKRPINEVLRVKMLKHYFIAEENLFPSFFFDYGFELFLLSFGSRQTFFFFRWVFDGIHLIINFKGGSGQNLKQRFTVVGYVDNLSFCFVFLLVLVVVGILVIFSDTVCLKVQFWVCVSEWYEMYDFDVM